MSKMFTATAILQLAGEGKVDLQASVGQYLSNYPNSDLASQVTVRQLLTHTGGTGDIFTPEYEKQRLNIRNLADYVKLYGSRRVAFKPGSQWAYSNYGFILLGLIVEKVSRMSFYDYVRSHIFEPLGMLKTDSPPESVNVPQRSVGYTARQGVWVNNVDTLPWRGTSAGGGYSTILDLYRFARGLCGGKLISGALFEEMISKQVKNARMPSNSAYGFGVHVSEGPQGKSFGNTGGAPGMNGELEVYTRTDTVVIALANLDPPSAMQLVDFFAQRMRTE
jgi:D-alanyl-D-alanine carboxypeptidase